MMEEKPPDAVEPRPTLSVTLPAAPSMKRAGGAAALLHGLHLLLALPVVELERPDQVTVCLAGRTWETEEAAVHTGLLMSQLEESVRRESLVVTGCPDSEEATLLLVVGGDTAVLTERVATALRSIQFSSYSGLVHLSLGGFPESIKLI